jgi:hypothetical protein
VPLQNPPNEVAGIEFSPTNDELVFLTKSGQLKQLRLNVPVLHTQLLSTNASTFAYLPDGSGIIVAERDGFAVWNISSGTWSDRLPSALAMRTLKLVPLKRGALFAALDRKCAGKEYTPFSDEEIECPITIWDITTHRSYVGDKFKKEDLQFLESEDYAEFDGLYVLDSDAYVILHDLNEESEKKFYANEALHADISTVAIARDVIASGKCTSGMRGGMRCAGGGVILWDRKPDADAQGDAIDEVDGFPDRPKTIVFKSAEGKALAVDVGDGNVFIVELSKKHHTIKLELGANAKQLAFLPPNGDTLVVLTESGRLTSWNLNDETWAKRACKIANRNLSEGEWDSDKYPLSENVCPPVEKSPFVTDESGFKSDK